MPLMVLTMRAAWVRRLMVRRTSLIAYLCPMLVSYSHLRQLPATATAKLCQKVQPEPLLRSEGYKSKERPRGQLDIIRGSV